MGIFFKNETIEEEQVQETVQTEENQAETAEIVNAYTDEMGIVAAETTIKGGIVTKGHLAIAGIVEGSVKADGNVMLSGTVKGSIECNNIIIDGISADFNNSIKAKGSVSIKEGSSLTGSVVCKHISVMGILYGNIKATGNVGLTKTAVVKGDISASVLAVEPGAKIIGNVAVK